LLSRTLGMPHKRTESPCRSPQPPISITTAPGARELSTGIYGEHPFLGRNHKCANLVKLNIVKRSQIPTIVHLNNCHTIVST